MHDVWLGCWVNALGSYIPTDSQHTDGHAEQLPVSQVTQLPHIGLLHQVDGVCSRKAKLMM